MKPFKSLNDQGAYVQANGLHIYYETYGEGIPVILLHGGLETCQMWGELLSFFPEGFQLITPDSRGHGRTDNPSGSLNYPLMAKDIVGLIQALKLEKPFLVGYSDSGQVALELAKSYPGLARGYMIGGVYHTLTKAWLDVMQGILGFEAPGVVDFERVMTTNAELVRSLEEKHDVFHEPGYWKSLLTQASLAWWEPPIHSPADFAKITDPALFWCGDRDVFCPPEQSLEMYRMVANAELAIIPGADHFSIMLKADLIAVMLDYFIRQITIKD